MNNLYINSLFKTLEKTAITDFSGEVYKDYSGGINRLIDIFSKHKKQGLMVYFIGNGGSAAIASHMTADFMKNAGMKTYSLYDNAVVTCMGNDYGYEEVFSRPLSFLLKKDDLLVAISSSGNSENIVRAVETAKKIGADIITLTGFDPDSRIRKMHTFNVYVPSHKYGMVETIHTIILQQIADMITERDGISL